MTDKEKVELIEEIKQEILDGLTIEITEDRGCYGNPDRITCSIYLDQNLVDSDYYEIPKEYEGNAHF